MYPRPALVRSVKRTGEIDSALTKLTSQEPSSGQRLDIDMLASTVTLKTFSIKRNSATCGIINCNLWNQSATCTNFQWMWTIDFVFSAFFWTEHNWIWCMGVDLMNNETRSTMPANRHSRSEREWKNSSRLSAVGSHHWPPASTCKAVCSWDNQKKVS